MRQAPEGVSRDRRVLGRATSFATGETSLFPASFSLEARKKPLYVLAVGEDYVFRRQNALSSNFRAYIHVGIACFGPPRVLRTTCFPTPVELRATDVELRATYAGPLRIALIGSIRVAGSKITRTTASSKHQQRRRSR